MWYDDDRDYGGLDTSKGYLQVMIMMYVLRQSMRAIEIIVIVQAAIQLDDSLLALPFLMSHEHDYSF